MEYHFDGKIYTDKIDFQRVLENDWYRKYSKYMIQGFFRIGKQFLYNGTSYEVLDNDAKVSKSNGWLYVQSISENPSKMYVHPRKVLSIQPELREQLDSSLEEQNIEVNTFISFEQLNLF